MDGQRLLASADKASPFVSSESSSSQPSETDGLEFTSFTDSESNSDILEPYPLDHNLNLRDLSEAVFDFVYETLPEHAIELQSYNGNNPLGATRIYRHFRGDRRTPDQTDLYKNLYAPLLEALASHYEDSPKTVDELCFVKKIKAGDIPDYVGSTNIYTHGACYYVKIPNIERDKMVKRNIGQKRSVASNTRTIDTVSLSPSIGLGHFLAEKRNSLLTLEENSLALGENIQNFGKLLACADKAVEQELNDQVMILDVKDLVIKHWNALVRKRRKVSGDIKQTHLDPPDDSDDPEGEREGGSSKRPYNHTNSRRTGTPGRTTNTSSSRPQNSSGSEDANNLSAMMQELRLLEDEENKARLEKIVEDPNDDDASKDSSQENHSGDESEFSESSSDEDDDDKGGPFEDTAAPTMNRPMDAAACAQAARHGSLEALQLAHRHGACFWDEWTCAFAAEQGHFVLLKWARLNGCPWDEWTCSLAAEHGQLEILQWAHFHGCPWDEVTCSSAAQNGHLEVLKWARSYRCPWDADCTTRAAENGHLNVLIWARSNGCPWNVSTCENAAKNGHFEVLQWAHQQGCPWDKWTCAHAASIGRLDILQWARENYCPWDASTCANAAKNGHLEILKWARANGCAWDARTYSLAAEHRHLHVLQWARANGCPRESDVAVGIEEEEEEEEEDVKLPASATSAVIKGLTPTVGSTLVTDSSWTVATGSVNPPTQQPADSSRRKIRFFGFARRWRTESNR